MYLIGEKMRLIPNKNMLLVIGESTIEQFELNTWKKISKLYEKEKLGLQKENTLIGNTNELYIFIKGLIYKFQSTLSEN
jgi:predicted transcriptional regulator